MKERRNRIIMVKRQHPKRVTLPNGRTFYAKYKRTTRAELPANVHLQRAYRQRAAPKGRRRRRRAAVGQRGRGFKSAFKKVFKKGFNIAKKVAKNQSVRNIAKAIINEAPAALEGLTKKVNNKTLKSILDNDITKTGVDLAAGYAFDKLQ